MTIPLTFSVGIQHESKQFTPHRKTAPPLEAKPRGISQLTPCCSQVDLGCKVEGHSRTEEARHYRVVPIHRHRYGFTMWAARHMGCCAWGCAARQYHLLAEERSESAIDPRSGHASVLCPEEDAGVRDQEI